MALKYVRLPLYADSYHSYSISLEGVSYILKLRYNERSEQWFIDLFLEDNTPLLLGMGLVPSYPIGLDYAIENLSGFFWMESIAEIEEEKYKVYPTDIYQYYRFFYIYEDGE